MHTNIRKENECIAIVTPICIDEFRGQIRRVIAKMCTNRRDVAYSIVRRGMLMEQSPN